VNIHWIGHASFLITSRDGTRVLTDPYDDSIGYRVPREAVNVVTVSHDHFDHGNYRAVPGNPEVLKDSGSKEVRGIHFNGIRTSHDEAGGTKRGRNLVFTMEIDGIHLAHMGDLGHVLDGTQVSQAGKVDVLLLPVGGVYTVDSREAWQVVEQLGPRIIIPMHFKTPQLKFELDPVDRFLRGKKNVKHLGGHEATLDKDSLPGEQEIWVLTPSH
jgi:L-ascorbate metabolism protein UlaG (beta-lactamase superfamily)